MRIPKARVPALAAEMLRSLTADGDIETDSPKEVQADIEAVLVQYIQDEQEISDQARELITRRGLPPDHLGKVKQQIAEQRKMKLGDEAIDYLLDQLLEILMHSNNVEEVYAPDHQLRRLLRAPLRKLNDVDDEVDKAVRLQMKHVQEGTQMWEVEYQRIMEDVRRRKGL
jgi:uncharacterized protein